MWVRGMATQAGQYTVSCTFQGEHVKGSPHKLIVTADRACARLSSVTSAPVGTTTVCALSLLRRLYPVAT